MENYKNSKIGLETAQKYGDILEMERPQTEESLRKHPRMTLQNRAKIFSPFSPLRGYDEQLAAEKQRTERVAKRILTEEEISALSDRLMQVTKGMTITVRYFKEDTAHPEVPAVGNYITLTGKADRIDPVFRTLQVGDIVVPFEDLVEVSGERIEENLPDFFTSSSSEMWEKGRSKDSDFPPVCLCRGCVWEENTV